MSTVDRWALINPPLQELKADTIDQPDKTWADRRGQFLDKLGFADPKQDPVIDILVRHLDELPADERDEMLRTERIDTIAHQLIEQGEPTEPVTAPYDEGEWQTYLAANGPRWNGTAEAWQAFRELFVYHANAESLADPAVALLDYLEGLDVSGRVDTFAQYGVVIPVTEEPAETKRKRTAPVETGAVGGGGGGDENEGEPPEKPQRRMSGRLEARAANIDLDAPTLTVRTDDFGVATQKLNTRQNIGFHMVATLTKPAGATDAVDALYDFWQEVRDGHTSEGGPTNPVGAAFVQDGPFQPNYQDPNITVTPNAIEFDDHPGFTTTSAIAVDDWLNTYNVHFQWRVRRRSTGQVWTSAPIHHSVVCPYDAGADVAVQSVLGGNQNWVVDLH